MGYWQNVLFKNQKSILPNLNALGRVENPENKGLRKYNGDNNEGYKSVNMTQFSVLHLGKYCLLEIIFCNSKSRLTSIKQSLQYFTQIMHL